MGYNLSGLLIKPAATSQALLETAFGCQLVHEATVSFEEATLNKYNSDYIDIYHTGQGTLVLCDQALYEQASGLAQLSVGGELMVFALSETAMAFYFQYFAGGAFQWEDGIVMDGHTQRLGNSALQLNDDTDIVFDTFGALSATYLGTDFHQVPLETPVTRYRLQRPAIEPTVTPIRQEEAFPLFNQFLTAIGQNKAPLVEEAPGKKVYSYETYLRLQGHTPQQAADQAAYIKVHQEAFNKWRKLPWYARSAALFYVYAGLIMVGVHGAIYALLALVAPSATSWLGYAFTLIGVLAAFFYLWQKKKQPTQPLLQLKYLDSDTFPA